MDKLEKKIIGLVLLLICLVGISALVLKRPDISVGFLSGGLISIFNFQFLKMHIHNLISAKSRFRYIIFFIGYSLRYVIMACALWLAINRGFGYFWSLAAGLFAVRISIFFNGIKNHAKPGRAD